MTRRRLFTFGVNTSIPGVPRVPPRCLADLGILEADTLWPTPSLPQPLRQAPGTANHTISRFSLCEHAQASRSVLDAQLRRNCLRSNRSPRFDPSPSLDLLNVWRATGDIAAHVAHCALQPLSDSGADVHGHGLASGLSSPDRCERGSQWLERSDLFTSGGLRSWGRRLYCLAPLRTVARKLQVRGAATPREGRSERGTGAAR